MTVPIEDGPRRTDPRSFAVRAISMLGQLVLPILFGAFAILDEGDLGDLALYFVPLVLVAVGANMAFAYLRWRRLTYTVGDADIRVESGILSRAARSVPYERIQDVSLEQKPVPRLFGLVEVKFETGAGGADEIKLAYLSSEEGEFDRYRKRLPGQQPSRLEVLPDFVVESKLQNGGISSLESIADT